MTTPANKLDPKDVQCRVRHTRMGIWDLYEDPKTDVSRIGGIAWTYAQIVESVPHISRTLKDILSIRRAWMPLSAFLVIEVLASLTPAVSLWYTGQLFGLAETVIETRTADSIVLVHVAAGHLTCATFHRKRIFNSLVCLDLPTYEELVSMGRISTSDYWVSGVGFQTVEMLMKIATTILRLLSQFLVLITVLREQQDGLLLGVLSLFQSIFYWHDTRTVARSLVWVATTANEGYVRMKGLCQIVDEDFYRKELVAGNLGECIAARFHESSKRVDDDAINVSELEQTCSVKDSLSMSSILREIIHILPLIVFTLRVVQRQMTIPLSLVSLILIYQTSNSFDICSMHAIDNMKNKVVDGPEPFPEDQQSLRSGISIEFRNVLFQYPGAEGYALRNVSFKIEAGQLCVIVGTNGSGKSTILNLICRIYDPIEGIILIDNRDIKTLRLADLRNAMSILFQDFTHFPLYIRENIGLGNPTLAHDDDKIRETARLGGAEEFINELLHGFNSYLHRPVGDYYAPLRVDFSAVKDCTWICLDLSSAGAELLNSSRTFMRSLASETESSAGMLLFDEPSASLDPMAEHDLFERLRKLRGNKTMIFSTHRFGNLTRHADLILYLDQTVQEQGTHDELMSKGGEYARMWNLQANAFI
ncbi:P-loop containing nucleoside triphosphate hydrolase protein [Suillus subalutaceus]|uniref:P-loop containing nucleoside triphosphate hydrolase protein n=1 Tax=Suillus subalutaceus TaxID=48586 RepID=UPI001B881B88|nr:P-loop containing nucleoside triphosphate hydrolase protein [Suillus subalutaceus]KAG1845091.1 P-loop containing nucleoside triphosphate hydrolase protein [Suillus subalutaceus]